MAKSCINTQCTKEIPSNAVFCSFCGSQQITDGELSIETRLRKELIEAHNTNKILETSLSEAHSKITNCLSLEDALLLKNELEAEQKKQESLKSQIALQQQEIQRLNCFAGKKKNNVLVFFMILFLLIAFYGGGTSISLRNDVKNKNNEINSLKARNNSYENEKRVFMDTQQTMGIENEKMRQKLEIVSNHYPIIIKSLKVGNVYADGNLETDFGKTIYAASSMYLIPQIEYIGIKPNQTITLLLKLYRENELVSGTSSPKGYSFKQEISTLEEGKIGLGGFGGSSKGHWLRGSYRYEVWHSNACLKTLDFYLY